ncbi:hypothetical protein Tco_1013629 [Tanacetum coccineum]
MSTLCCNHSLFPIFCIESATILHPFGFFLFQRFAYSILAHYELLPMASIAKFLIGTCGFSKKEMVELFDLDATSNCVMSSLAVSSEEGEVNMELESGAIKLREKLSQEEDSEEKAPEEFNSTLDNVLEKLSQEKDSPEDLYGFMYDTDDDASISGKSCEHFGWDWPKKDSLEVAKEVIEMANDQAEAL